MNSKATNQFRHFKQMWKTSIGVRQSALESTSETDFEPLDDLCIRADLCESSEEYIKTLCSGMIDLLESGVSTETLERHPLIYDKLMRLGGDIMSQSYNQSDQFYIGLFVSIRIKYDWLKAKFFRLIKNMLHQVLDMGLRISEHLRKKIKEHLEEEDHTLFKEVFPSKLKYGS